MKKNIQLLLIFLVSLGQITKAQIVTDRPDQTESSSTVPGGSLQIESGILVGFEGDNQFSTSQALLPTNLFRYGISNLVELRILNQFESYKFGDNTIQGLSDIEVGAKVQLLKNSQRNTEIALISHILFPSGTAELTNDQFGSINKISISHRIKENLGIGYNLGYNYLGVGNGDLTYSVALGIRINDKIGIYIEPYGKIINVEDFILNIDGGLTYLLNNNLQLDFSFGTGINNRMNYVSVGCSWLILKNSDDNP